MPDENKNAIKNAINLSFRLIILTFYLILLDFTLIQRTLYADKVNQFYKTIKVIGNKINVSADITLSITPTNKEKGLDFVGPSLLSEGAVTYSPAFAVPSARQGLTSLFGMGRGGALALSPP